MTALRLMMIVLVVAVSVDSETTLEEVSDPEYDQEAGNYSDHGQDIYYEYYEELELGNITLRKCFCGQNEALTGNICEKKEIILYMLHSNFKEVIEVNTAEFRNVTTGEIDCPSGTKRIDLPKSFSHQDIFYILESGKLEWNSVVSDNYCLELIYNPASLQYDWHAQVCELPIIPTCCLPGHSMGFDGTCVKSEEYTFYPPISLEGQVSRWHSEISVAFTNLSCQENEEMDILELDNRTVLLNHLQLEQHLLTVSLVINDEGSNVNYCIGVLAGSEQNPIYKAKICYRDQLKEHNEKCRDRTCVRKCCADQQYFTPEGCVPYNDSETNMFQPNFHSFPDLIIIDKPKDLTVVYGGPLCGNPPFRLQPHVQDSDKFFLLHTGSLHAPSLTELYPPTRYCLESELGDDGKVKMFALACFEEITTCSGIQDYLYPVMMIISIGFLTITLLVYLSFPELHAMVHGKCLVSHVSALLVSYISLLIVQWTTTILPDFGCKFMASMMQFSFLAAFFWLNVMCFDIWWTLKSMNPVPETGELSRLRFKLYSLYSWGCPLVITIATVVVQNLPRGIVAIRPDLGESRCWFNNKTTKWAYFYGIILVLLVVNMVFFLHVAYILIFQHSHSILQRNKQQNRERMWLYVKLFVVMGITWLAEVISWHEGSCWGWIVMDVINSLQGVFIFLVFMYNRNLIKKVRGKLEPYLRQVKEVLGNTKLSLSRPTTSEPVDVAREHHSFSSSENRTSDSGASQRTLQSQLSLEPSENRKISTGSSIILTGVEVHTRDMSQDTISHSPCPGENLTQTFKVSVAIHLKSTSEKPKEEEIEKQTENCDITVIRKPSAEEASSNRVMKDDLGEVQKDGVFDHNNGSEEEVQCDHSFNKEMDKAEECDSTTSGQKEVLDIAVENTMICKSDECHTEGECERAVQFSIGP